MNTWNFKVKAVTVILVAVAFWIVSVVAVLQVIDKLPTTVGSITNNQIEKQRVVDEESVTIDVVDKVSPSVVSIAVENKPTIDFFGIPQQGKQQESGIGTGFVVSADGLIMTNKHVVSADGERPSFHCNGDED